MDPEAAIQPKTLSRTKFFSSLQLRTLGPDLCVGFRLIDHLAWISSVSAVFQVTIIFGIVFKFSFLVDSFFKEIT